MTGAARAADMNGDGVIDSKSFREAMSRYASSVHVVTTDGPAGRCGLTATAVTSLSDAPPTVLICVNRGSRVNAAIKENAVLCVNTLCADDRDLSDAFAGRGGLSDEDRFALGEWTRLATGAPVLASARVAVDARVDRLVETDTHTVVFARVIDIAFGSAETATLIHLDRDYYTV